jgi:Sec-independent protein secretion pathway component TatC
MCVLYELGVLAVRIFLRRNDVADTSKASTGA